MIIEYLIITEQSDNFCESETAFLQFIKVATNFNIDEKNKKISFLTSKKKKLVVSFFLKSDLTPSKKERYFHFTLQCDDENEINNFNELSETIKKIILRLNEKISINTLWNDISRKFAIEGYMIINEIENLMRKLIAKFMLVNVGLEWTKKAIPEEIAKKIDGFEKSDNQNIYVDDLYKTYFIDLINILFRKYREQNINDLELKINRAKEKNMPIDELQVFIAKSNWEKYIAKEVSLSGEINNYNTEKLESDWNELNKLRNQIAHNRHITRQELGKIENISQKVKKFLSLSIETIDKVTIPEKDRNSIKETEHKRFIHEDELLEQYIFDWVKEQLPDWTVAKNYRDLNSGFEVDILAKKGSIRIGFEIKIRLSSRVFMQVERYMAWFGCQKFFIITIDENKDYEFYKLMLLKVRNIELIFGKIIDGKFYSENNISEIE